MSTTTTRRTTTDPITYGAYPYRVHIHPNATAKDVDKMLDFLGEQELELTSEYEQRSGELVIYCQPIV